MTILALILMMVCTAQFIILIMMSRNHKTDMEIIAADFSERLQDYQRKLTIICTEPSSQEALDVCLHIQLNHAAEEMLNRHKEGNESINLN